MKVAIFGDLILDHYLIGTSSRISPEAPIPIVNILKDKYLLGGACNVARNLKSFGLDVSIFGLLGEDKEGDIVISLLNELGVTTEGISRSLKYTPLKTRVQVGNQQIVRLDREEIELISSNLVDVIIQKYSLEISDYSVIIISDYSKGFLSDYMLKKIIKLANRNNVKIIGDPKGVNYKKYNGFHLITPNKSEAEIATGIQISNPESLKSALISLKKIINSKISIITLGPEGIALYKDEKITIFPALASEVYDVTGAGDTVISAIAYGICNSWSYEESIVFANKAASVVVKKFGPAVASLKEINQLENGDVLESTLFYFNSIMESNFLSLIANQKVVFIHGIFDVFNLDLINNLQEAKGFGEVLVVGLKSDIYVNKIKGEKGLKNCELNRAKSLLSLKCVDFVVIFNDENPVELVNVIRPSIFVKRQDFVYGNLIDYSVDCKILNLSVD